MAQRSTTFLTRSLAVTAMILVVMPCGAADAERVSSALERKRNEIRLVEQEIAIINFNSSVRLQRLQDKLRRLQGEEETLQNLHESSNDNKNLLQQHSQ